MCGIAGFINWRSKTGADALAAANCAIAHRGPDDAGLQLIDMKNGNGCVGLANRRLAILDLSPAGHQPMSDPTTGNWIAYNGEVFNFQEIRTRLEGEGAQFTSHTDTEVIMKAYAAYGKSCVDHFRGMFAFSIWDSAAQKLFVARDRFGKKPLYYFQGDGFLFFASEVRALLATGLIPRRINEDAVEQYLSFGSICDPQTLISGVKALPAGSHMTWSNGAITIRKYWDAASFAGRNFHQRAEEKEVVAGLEPLLTEAINLRMVSDVPVGVFLSGGIDSSALVAILAGTQQQKISTFSVVFKEGDYSEAEFSSLVARRFKTDHHEIHLTAEDFLASVPDALTAMDQPSLDGFNTYTISREVRRTGLKVALSGQGGDELFAGYKTFRAVPKMERFQSFERWLPAPLRAAAAWAVPGADSSDRNRKIAALIQGNGSMLHPYFLARMMFVPRQLCQLLKSGTMQAVNEGMSAALAPAAALDPVNRVSYLELTNYMANTLLRDGDCMSMAHGLEIRVPLLDHKLAEYTLSVPGEMKIDSRTPKHLLVKAMRGLLPDEIVHRPKKGFTLPFEHWMRGELKSSVESVLTRIGEGPLGSVLNPSAVMQVWQSFLDGKTAWSRPWCLYVLDRWCQKNL
ncbi:MAG TPA: asparagine synthase (glutamine-hydrolyzing) [Candidatus Angelobacter sp.]|jgi:asparagine synthase (glutamine-hydrolysing)